MTYRPGGGAGWARCTGETAAWGWALFAEGMLIMLAGIVMALTGCL